MAQRHVGGLAGLDGEGNPHQLRLLRVDAGGLGIEGEAIGGLQTGQPRVELGLLQKGVVLRLGLDRAILGCDFAILARRLGLAQQLVEPLLELQLAVERDQRLAVRLAGHQVGHLHIQRHIDLDRRQLVGHEGRLAVLLQLGPQGLGATNRQRRDLVELVIEPLESAGNAVKQAAGGFFADAGHTGDVVDLVAHQREEIDDQLRTDAKLGAHALDVVDAAGHGVDQGDVRADQLRHVLVAGGNHHVAPQRRALACQSANHVIRLDPLDAEQRQAQRAHAGMQRLDLAAQIIRHRRAVGFVFGEQLVAEGRALGIEDHGEGAVRILPAQRQQHVQHALHRAGRFAGGGGQRRQGVEGAVKVGRTVHQNEGRLTHERDQPFRRAPS